MTVQQQSKSNVTQQTSIADNSLKLWITDDYYLEVDEQGHVMGPCYEGALGCVLQLRSESRSKKVALKIPRLLADTPRENAYIAEILAHEEGAADKANGDGRPIDAGLVQTEALPRYCLCGPRLFTDSSSDKKKQRDGFIFVSFAKGTSVRLCNVKYDEQSRKCVIFPSGVAPDIGMFVNPETWPLVCKESQKGTREFHSAIYITRYSGSLNTNIVIAGLAKTMELRSNSEYWFGAIPSVTYQWASGTLQELIALDRHAEWEIHEHYQLFLNMLRAVKWLHRNGMLHGDIRPANIMAIGDMTAARNFALGDYGSFSHGQAPLLADDGRRHGQTIMGPGLNKLRTSIFYAPERRSGQELESVDTAVILANSSHSGNSEYCIHLTWRSQLYNSAGLLKMDLIENLRKSWNSSPPTTVESGHFHRTMRLCPLDRIRLRDYIFTVRRSVPKEPLTIYCDRRYAQVCHEQIAIYQDDNNPIRDLTILSLDKYTEIYQWSVATDLYGIGVLALYSLHTGALIAKGRRNPQSSSAGDSQANKPKLSKMQDLTVKASTEQEISGILRMLEDDTCFNYVWPDLEKFRNAILCKTASVMDGHGLLELRVDNAPAGEVIKDFGRDTINNLLHLVPSLHSILELYEYNVAEFLLSMHFILSCIRRRSDLKDPRSEATFTDNKGKEHKVAFPFCSDRTEKASGSQAAEWAVVYLEEIYRLRMADRFKDFVESEEKFLKESTGSEIDTKIKLSQLQDKFATQGKEYRSFVGSMKAYSDRLSHIAEDIYSLSPRRIFQIPKAVRSLVSDMQDLVKKATLRG